MTDINNFLEKECGINENTSIIEEELDSEVDDLKVQELCNILSKNKILDPDLKKNFQSWKNNINSENHKNFNYYFENNYLLIKELLNEVMFKDQFYLFTQKINPINKDDIKVLKNEVLYIENTICNKKNFYNKENESLITKKKELKDKLNKMDLKKVEEKYSSLQSELKNKQDKKENVSLFDTLKFNDDIDKLNKEIKIIKQELKEIPENRQNINIEIQELSKEISFNYNNIEILSSFPIEDYINYLKLEGEKIEKNNKKSNSFLFSFTFLILLGDLFYKNMIYNSILLFLIPLFYFNLSI